MPGRRTIFTCLLAASLLAALVGAGASQAHQRATLSSGVLTITGDYPASGVGAPSPPGTPKPNDLVTVDFDASDNEFIFGQDVFGPHPAQCSPDADNPQRIIHCPASLIDLIVVRAGIGSDTVCADSLTGAPNDEARAACRDVNLASNASLKVSMGSGGDRFQGGPEKDNASGGPGSDQLYGGGGKDRLTGGGSSDKLFGQGGADKLFGGGAPDKLFGGPGNDDCRPGGGVGKEKSC
jgi:Ca2+-binding RTX toxin-like protein